MLNRAIQIQDNLEKNKVLIIYGPRQVGKTTLVNAFLKKTSLQYKFFTGDDLVFSNDFSKCDLNLIKKMIGNTELLVIDEAQKINLIGQALKLVVDHIPGIYVIATGSSSFDLANETEEPLTGRKNQLNLFPVSILELLHHHTEYEIEQNVGDYLVYGSYPEVVTYNTFEKKQQRITEIMNAYLIKDIMEFQKIKRAQSILDLLRLLAYQTGSEVSTLELSNTLKIDNKTVSRYLQLLEKSFVIFSLQGFSKNLRKEVTKMKKYYFYDIGIRNALISNFNRIETRNDAGQLWENFLAVERKKRNAYKMIPMNYYFWRIYNGKEIDWIEERDGNLYGFEFKWREKKVKAPKLFTETYPNATFEVVTPGNFLHFVS
ncbi:MAG: ATP-binding protein [Chitinophagaceae bacterium]|nr:MAG: ATP-binding protein [Chitinophagaceae bacterium]